MADTNIAATPARLSKPRKAAAEVENQQQPVTVPLTAHADVELDKELFEPFSWLREPANRCIDCTKATQDISAGVALILELIESSELAKDCGDRPILSVTSSGQLMRLAITSLGLLHGHAEEIISWRNKRSAEAAERGKQ